MSIRLAFRGAATTRMTGTIRDSIRHTLEGRLGYRFQSEALLVQALTHRSHGRQHNERLEFLGDSVLNCAVASLLYARFADSPEGALSRLRANLVKQDPLHDIACGLSLPDALILGEGERKSGGHRRPSILADAVEALLGAIFLESGFAAAAGVVAIKWYPKGATTNSAQGVADPQKLDPILEAMQQAGLLLLIHGEVTTDGVDIFDREATFIDSTLEPLRRRFPRLPFSRGGR